MKKVWHFAQIFETSLILIACS